MEVFNSKAVPVDVDSLRIGMYVSALDRPWLETPFLFQGFHIRDAEDIAALRQHCRVVYVDPEESAEEIDFSALTGAAPPRSPQRSLPRPAADAGGVDERQSVYTDIAELRHELGEARDQHQQAMLLVREVMDNLSNGGKLDVDTARKATQPIVDSVLKNRSAMTWLVRLRQEDDYIYTHSVSSAIWATVMARHIGMPKEEIELVGLGAMLLDIGKTRLPKELLAKPGPLTPEEMRLARRHVAFGVALLEDSGVDSTVMAMVHTHHERHDGSGYPNRLRAGQIPVHGRIAGIVDFYDAVTSDRPYARARSSYDCLRALNRLAGRRFQAEIVEQFIQSIGFFPPGTLVELNDGCVAVVVAQNRRHRLKPEVLLVTGPDKNLLHEFRLLDLQMPMRSNWTDEPLHIDRGLEPGSHGIDPAEFFLG